MSIRDELAEMIYEFDYERGSGMWRQEAEQVADAILEKFNVTPKGTRIEWRKPTHTGAPWPE